MIKYFTDYQLLVLTLTAVLNCVCCGITILFCYGLVKWKGFRDAVAEAIQDNDKAYNWVDARNVGLFVAGYLCAWFTMNITSIFVYNKMFETGPLFVIGTFVAVTFTLWGIAWKK